MFIKYVSLRINILSIKLRRCAVASLRFHSNFTHIHKWNKRRSRKGVDDFDKNEKGQQKLTVNEEVFQFEKKTRKENVEYKEDSRRGSKSLEKNLNKFEKSTKKSSKVSNTTRRTIVKQKKIVKDTKNFVPSLYAKKSALKQSHSHSDNISNSTTKDGSSKKPLNSNFFDKNETTLAQPEETIGLVNGLQQVTLSLKKEPKNPLKLIDRLYELRSWLAHSKANSKTDSDSSFTNLVLNPKLILTAKEMQQVGTKSANVAIVKEIPKEYSREAILLKKQMEMDRPDYTGFKFFNYDELSALGTGGYELEFLDQTQSRIYLINIEKDDLEVKKIYTWTNPSLLLTLPETKNFCNRTSVLALQRIGKLLVEEYVTRWCFFSKATVHSIVNRVKKQCEQYRLHQINNELGNSLSVQYTGFNAVYVFLGMMYLEDLNYERLISKIVAPTAKENSLKMVFHKNLLIDKYLLDIGAKIRLMSATLDNKIFSQIRRPPLLTSLPYKLPPIPKYSDSRMYHFLQYSLLAVDYNHGFRGSGGGRSRRSRNSGSDSDSYSGNGKGVKGDAYHMTLKDSFKLEKLAIKLDKYGDAVLSRFSTEFLIQLLKQNPNFRWNTDDLFFLNTNVIFSRLSFAYSLHEAIDNQEHRRLVEQKILLSHLNEANEILGDLFERLVAVTYIQDPERCREWVFKIYECILMNLKTRKRGDVHEFIDKKKFLELYRYHLRTSTMY
ncbi:hypothetical protein LELG_02294 [Lodderomyces elongisporus NRRL YB-4239]|uniref:RNase III domain-containing protein n=1 Tax=Lodderomyces elongisporus (strain ATCC 11503 / CBS 2605 / JCM 1781 / NBRC 1676 / NRRL YB-4239) TaxID=379508 RepID=A5DY57_LODEL|nr:hypothetical protein LELG_02294 [Lodderomyces elongisporus NRRL YB-4239]